MTQLKLLFLPKENIQYLLVESSAMRMRGENVCVVGNREDVLMACNEEKLQSEGKEEKIMLYFHVRHVCRFLRVNFSFGRRRMSFSKDKILVSFTSPDQ